FVKMEDCFCIAVRLVDVAVCFQRLAIVGVVVDLAVVGDVQRSVFVGHWLMTRGDFDDAETAMTETYVSVDKDAFLVRSAMGNDVAHRFQRSARDGSPGAARKRYPINTAHTLNLGRRLGVRRQVGALTRIALRVMPKRRQVGALQSLPKCR